MSGDTVEAIVTLIMLLMVAIGAVRFAWPWLERLIVGRHNCRYRQTPLWSDNQSPWEKR